MSTRPPSPTQTEWNTFQVMANRDFVNIRAQKPTREDLQAQPVEEAPVQEEPEHDQIDDNEADHEVGPDDSISVAHAAQGPSAGDERERMPAIPEDEDNEDDERPDPRVDERTDRRHREDPPERRRSVSQRSETSAASKDSRAKKPNATHVYSDFVGPDADQYETLKRRAREMTEAEIETEKEGLLTELSIMEKQGIVKLLRPLTIHDSLEEIQFQYDRAQSNYNAMQAVDWAKTGLKVMASLMEMSFNKMGLKLLDGFSGHLCKDMTRFNRPLTRMYRKYWRGGNLSAEAELALIVFGAVAMTIMHNKGLGMFANMMPSYDPERSHADKNPTGHVSSSVPPMARPTMNRPVPMGPTMGPTVPVSQPVIPSMTRPVASAHTEGFGPSIPTMKRPTDLRPIPMGSVGPEPERKTVVLNQGPKVASKKSKAPESVLNF